MSSMTTFVYEQLFTRLPYPTTDFSHQTIIVTGSNTGLGLEAARHFTRLNAEKVVLAVRNVEKGHQAKKSIEQSTGRQGVVEVWQLDLSSYESTKQCAQKAETLKRLDIVVENAGVARTQYSVEEDNESTITTNVVSTFLLGLMLLPKLRESGKTFNVTPRLAIVTSEVHFWSNLSEWRTPDIFKTLNDKETANMGERYPVSKLLEVLYARELAAHTSQSGKSDVVINLINPGLCHSELARDSGWGLYIMKLLLARTTEHGSRTLVHAAQGGAETHGQYLSNCRVADASPFVLSDDGGKAQKKVWDQLSQKLEAIQPGVMASV